MVRPNDPNKRYYLAQAYRNLGKLPEAIAEYKKASAFKLTRLLINQLYQPAERVYARGSVGYYEEMFAGAGGQVLYLPVGARWGADLAVDWVAQRNHEGLGFSFYDYQTTTAIASFHYRLPLGMTATARGGRFLAKDEGVRIELKRRFASGWEVGAWYTRTNGNDITSPGSPGNPYYDKGLFMTIPLNTLLTRDTQATAPMSISPWTRDVGAMPFALRRSVRSSGGGSSLSSPSRLIAQAP